MAESFTVATHTAGDGYRWHYRHYCVPSQGHHGARSVSAGLPDSLADASGSVKGRTLAQVICLHGIQSHGGWYDHSCARLAGAGFDVFFLDRRGSGRNDKDRGDAPSFRRLLDDIAEFLRATRRDGLKTFLLAVSWGGKLAAALPKRHPGLIDGLALLCPGFFPKVRPPLGERARIAWSYLTAPRRPFPIPLNDPELFTASPRWQQFLRDDPLALHAATARLLLHSVRLDGYLRFVPAHVRVPVLLQLAGQDRIIDNARTRRFVESFAAADKTVIEYPEAHHTLEFEGRPHRYLDDLISWLVEHSPR